MRLKLIAATALALGVGLGDEVAVAQSLAAQPLETKVEPAEYAVPNTRVIDFVSSVNKHRYRINIALPSVPAPPKGYRVLYIFDGNYIFASVAEAVRANGNAPDVIVVGIGYPDSAEFAAESEARHSTPALLASLDPVSRAKAVERGYDLTLPATSATLDAEVVSPSMKRLPRDVGGVDELLRTIEADVKPRIAALAKVDTDNQALFGHSLGGLAVLRALFTEPGAFRTFIAASPSIWWNDRAVLADEANFAALVEAGKASPRILITVGADENAIPKELPPSFDRDAVIALVKRANMVGNARDLSGRLAAIKGSPGYEAAGIALFEDQDHGISVWPAIGRAITFAFQRP